MSMLFKIFRPFKDKRGIALITSLLLLSALSAMGLVAINTTGTDLKISGNVREKEQSFYLAEAGISHARDVVYKNLANWDSYAAPGAPILDNISLGAGHYTVTIADAGDNRRRLLSTGATSTGAQTQIEVILDPGYSNSSPFISGLHGCDGVAFSSNGKTSSYSSSGAYSDGNRGDISTSNSNAAITLASNAKIKGNVFATGALTLNSNAKVYKDALATGNITMASNSHIYGDASSSGTISVAGNAEVDGTVTQNVSTDVVPITDCDPLDITSIFDAASDIQYINNNDELDSDYYNNADDSFSIGSNNSYSIGATGQQKQYDFSSFGTLSNADVTIEGDVTLYIDGDFSMSSNSQILFAPGAALTIYVTGNFTLASNTRINNAGSPIDLKIFSNAESSSNNDYKINFYSNSDLYGVVYSPKTAIQMNSNADYFGAMRGKYIDMASNSDFTYDEDLGDGDFGGGGGNVTGFTEILWKEIN